MADNNSAHIKPGVYIALLLTAVTLFFYFTGIQTGSNIQMALRVLIVAIGVAICCYLFKKQSPGLTGKEVFFSGFRVTAIVTLCTIAFGVLFVLLVPHFKEEAVAAFQKDQLMGSRPEDRAKIDADVDMYKSRFLTLFIGMNMMIVVVSGLIGSLLGTLITAKKQ